MVAKTDRTVLALGAGSVARPCVQYLLKKGCGVVSVDIEGDNARRVLDGHPGGTPVVANAAKDAGKLISEYAPGVVVCLLPTAFMVEIARICIEHGVSMVGASYVKDEMRALDARARERGVTILCEMGLDPGIDHMSAVARIESIKAAGGVVEGFQSICGALPDLRSNTNPFGYKLSWAPASLIGASKRSARIVVDGERIDYPDGATYQHPSLTEIDGVGWFEMYANADSLPYIEAYGIPEARNIYRGTLRYPGWCETISAMQKLGLFDERTRDFAGKTVSSLVGELVGARRDGDLAARISDFLGLPQYSSVMEKLAWLGLFDDAPVSPERGSVMDVVSNLYADKLRFAPGEYDLVAMRHRFDAVFPSTGKRKAYTSTLIARGPVDGDTAIATTTGTPMGIGARLIMENAVTGKGVIIPTTADIYKPALAALEEEGMTFTEAVYCL